MLRTDHADVHPDHPRRRLRRRARVEGNPLGKVYSSFRGKAKEHVVAALPGLGATLEGFVR